MRNPFNRLGKFIKDEFPKRQILYRDKIFYFHSDLQVKDMEAYTNSDLTGIPRVKYILHIFSHKPKLTMRVLNTMPSQMLMELYYLLVPKKDSTSSPETISPSATTISASSPPSSTNPAVNSAIGDITKSPAKSPSTTINHPKPNPPI